jgi:hypothetical protein
MRRAISAAALAALTAACVGACIGKDPYSPGTGLGTFHVTAKLVATSCGQAPDPWEFDVKLATDPGTLYWIQGDVPVTGKLDGTTHEASMMETTTVPVVTDKAGNHACILERDDAFSATLTPDTAADKPGAYSAFSGKLSYTFKVGDGSTDCSTQLASSGGPYPTLPCSVAYTLTATRTALPNAYGK